MRMVGTEYRLGTLIGSGSTGEVWVADSITDGHQVAIKILSPALASDPAAVVRFVQERDALTGVRSPDLVTVHELIPSNGTLAIVMDLVDGVNLRSYVRQAGTLTPAVAAGLVGQVLGALSVIHRAGIIHRDVKPENILVDLTELDQPRALLSDFGIAMIVGDTAEHGSPSLAGTLPYLAPEVPLEGASELSDIYATGVVLYELLAGRPPFEAPDAVGLLRAHRDDAPPPIPGLTPGLQALLDRMLAKSPQDRPALAVVARELLSQAAIEAGSAPALPPMPSAGGYRGPTVPPAGAPARASSAFASTAAAPSSAPPKHGRPAPEPAGSVAVLPSRPSLESLGAAYRPGFAGPGPYGSSSSGPGFTAPGSTAPALSGPGVSGPGSARPGLAGAGFAGPGLAVPGFARSSEVHQAQLTPGYDDSRYGDDGAGAYPRTKAPSGRRRWLLPIGLAGAGLSGLVAVVMFLSGVGTGQAAPVANGPSTASDLPSAPPADVPGSPAAAPSVPIPTATAGPTPSGAPSATPRPTASPSPSTSAVVPTRRPGPTAQPVGSGLIRVPMLTGKTLGEANSRLSARGLRSAVPTYDCFGADRPQEVVSQDPKPGTRVSATATVSVSVQDDCATVPSVVGQSLSAAVKTLRDAGFSSIIQGGGGNDGGGQGTDIVYLQFPGSGTSQPKSRTMFVQAESAAQPEPSPPAAANAQQG